MALRHLALVPAAVAALVIPAAAAEPERDTARFVPGPHGTQLLAPPAVADEFDFVVRAGRRPVSGHVRIFSATGSRQYESEPYRIKAGGTYRLTGRRVPAAKVRVSYSVGLRGKDRRRVVFTVARPEPATTAAAAHVR